MSTKSQSTQKRQQAKAKARAKKVKHNRQVRERQIAQATSRLHTEAMLRSVAQNGVMKTALAHRDMHRRVKDKDTKQEFTNVEVLQGVNEIVPFIATVHGGIEVVEILVNEKKTSLSEAEVAIINAFDKATVRLTEDVNTMILMIEHGKKPEDYFSIFVHYLDLTAEIMDSMMPSIHEQLLTSREQIITEYVSEHKLETEDNFAFGFRVHDQRMKRIAPLYRTREEEALGELVVPAAQHEGLGEDDQPFVAEGFIGKNEEVAEAELVQAPVLEQ